MQSLHIDHSCSVRENCKVEVFATYGQPAGRPRTDHHITLIFHVSQTFTILYKRIWQNSAIWQQATHKIDQLSSSC